MHDEIQTVLLYDDLKQFTVTEVADLKMKVRGHIQGKSEIIAGVFGSENCSGWFYLTMGQPLKCMPLFSGSSEFESEGSGGWDETCFVMCATM